jgi:hypothetical protein
MEEEREEKGRRRRRSQRRRRGQKRRRLRLSLLPPPPPPWSKYFSKNSLRVICSKCFAGNHHVRAPYCVHCDDELETDVYRNFY